MPTWSFTVNADNRMDMIPTELELSSMALQHDQFPRDMQMALTLARTLNLHTFTCTGMRAESPYDGSEIVDVSVRGVPFGDQFFETMKEVIGSGPESGRADPVLHENEHR